MSLPVEQLDKPCWRVVDPSGDGEWHEENEAAARGLAAERNEAHWEDGDPASAEVTWSSAVCWVALCAGCGDRLYDDDGSEMHFSTRAEAEDAARTPLCCDVPAGIYDLRLVSNSAHMEPIPGIDPASEVSGAV